MKLSFQAWYVGVLAYVALFDATSSWRGPRARKGMMNAPPGGLLGGGVPVAPAAPATQAGGALSSNSTRAHPFAQTSGVNGGTITAAAPGSYYLYSVREVEGSFAAITLPSAMWLQDVCVESGTAAGTFEIGYAASNNAHFVAPASAVTAAGTIGLPYVHHVPVSWAAPATIPSGTFTANGSVQAGTLTFSTLPGAGLPDISSYRAMYTAAAFANTTAVTETITFDNGPAIARAVIALIGNTTGTLTGVPYASVNYQNGSQYTQLIQCQGNLGPLQIVPLQPVAASYSFTSSYNPIGLGGTTDITIYGIWFY